MPKVSPEHMEKRRNQILDAATACFAQHGIRETTIHRICEEAGLSAGALYRYFPGKEAILHAVYERSLGRNRAFGDQIAAAADPLAAVRSLLAGMVHFVGDPALEREHHLSIRVYAEGLTDRALARSYMAMYHDIVAQVAPLIARLQCEGRIAADVDPEYLLWVVLAAYQGLRIQRMLEPELDLERFARALDRVLGAALSPR